MSIKLEYEVLLSFEAPLFSFKDIVLSNLFSTSLTIIPSKEEHSKNIQEQKKGFEVSLFYY